MDDENEAAFRLRLKRKKGASCKIIRVFGFSVNTRRILENGGVLLLIYEQMFAIMKMLISKHLFGGALHAEKIYRTYRGNRISGQ
ncbi:hypothetical protein PSTEL_11885 [Paenibacillus stellifer]|uniref:Uncharacterized protein n=1 Tax=Paenibacillus stellifer TaxID=169760 RepID=A0A089LRY0_9BACL|nr:hypothetical protein PSTEL_11885 [Paenibacillus stellifer]